MKRIAICNSKGGVGKSTGTISMAVTAVKNGYKVLLIDIDPQGTCTFLSHLDSIGLNNASKMFQDEPVNPSELAIKTKYGYDIVAAAPSLLESSDWIHKTSMGEQRLSLLFKRDVDLDKYDFVFIDTAGDKSRLVYSVLYAVYSVLIPVRPSAIATNELVDFVEIINDVSAMRVSLGQIPLECDSVYFTLLEEFGGNPTIAAKSNMADVRVGLKDLMPVSETTIPTSTAVEKAALEKAPVVSVYPDEKVSLRYSELFNEVYG